MKNKYVYNVDKDNQKIAKISISKNLSTKKIEGMFNMILSCIKTKRGENDIDTPKVEVYKGWGCK